MVDPRRKQISLESLESRRLLSVVNVTAYTTPGAADSTPGITQAIRSSKPGDTIYFASGTYNLGSTVIFEGDRTYEGAAGATLMTANGSNLKTAETDTGNSNNITSMA